MGKIKSAILTAILVLAIATLAFFATVSLTVPGAGGVKKYNSFISSISLGGELSGEAVSTLYPKGVISEADYQFALPDEQAGEKYDEYVDKYKEFAGVRIEKQELGDDLSGNQLKAKVEQDAKILSKRLGEKGYSAYSVSVKDDFTISVSFPTGFSYAEYADEGYSTSSRSDKQTAITSTVKALAYGGKLSLRNSDVGQGRDKILTPITADVSSYFKGFSSFKRAGTFAVKVDLTKSGETLFADISKQVTAAQNDKAIGFYIGDNQLISLSLKETISGNSFLITTSNEAASRDYAIVLDSCIKGDVISLDYGTANDVDTVYASAELGGNAAIFLFCSVLAMVITAIVYSAVRYKMLGFANSLVVVVYTLTMIVAIFLLNIQLTVVGALFVTAGLALLCGSNFAVFEKIRRETQKGKTMRSAIKAGYKSLLKGLLELHIVVIAVSLILALVCVGELAACGFIFFIASTASYLLYWFTRLLWFVLSYTTNNAFAFCGFKREEQDD